MLNRTPLMFKNTSVRAKNFMKTTLYHVDSALRRLGYSKMKQEEKYKKTYYKVERTGSEYVCKIAVCIDLIGSKVLTNEGIEIIKGIAAVQFEGATPDNVLVIALDRKGTANVNGKNIILYDRDALKIKGKTSELYMADLEFIKTDLKERKRDDAHKKALWENGIKQYSTTIIYIMVAFIVWMHFSNTGANSELYGISAYQVYRNGQSYRLVTYLFTHASIAHLLSNSTSLVLIGRMYARKRNPLDVLIVFMGGGIIAGICSVSYKMVTYESTVYTVGASGAVFAILGALLANVFMDNATIGYRKEYVKYAVVTLVLSALGSNTDNVCHIAGFLSGAAFDFLLTKADNICAYSKFIETRDKTRTTF